MEKGLFIEFTNLPRIGVIILSANCKNKTSNLNGNNGWKQISFCEALEDFNQEIIIHNLKTEAIIVIFLTLHNWTKLQPGMNLKRGKQSMENKWIWAGINRAVIIREHSNHYCIIKLLQYIESLYGHGNWYATQTNVPTQMST